MVSSSACVGAFVDATQQYILVTYKHMIGAWWVILCEIFSIYKYRDSESVRMTPHGLSNDDGGSSCELSYTKVLNDLEK